MFLCISNKPETGWYYLQSRYYDPVIHLFINADGLASTGKGVLGCNMFAYCNNNPSSFSDSAGTVPVSVEIATVTDTIQINDEWAIVVSVSWDASFGNDAVNLTFGKGSFTVTANAATGENTSFKADFSFSDDPQVKGSWGTANKRFFVKADMMGESVGAQYTTTLGNIECDITISLRCNSTWAIGKRILKKAAQSLAGAANPYGGNGHLQNGLFYGVSPVTTAAGNVFPWTMQLK